MAYNTSFFKAALETLPGNIYPAPFLAHALSDKGPQFIRDLTPQTLAEYECQCATFIDTKLSETGVSRPNQTRTLASRLPRYPDDDGYYKSRLEHIQESLKRSRDPVRVAVEKVQMKPYGGWVFFCKSVEVLDFHPDKHDSSKAYPAASALPIIQIDAPDAANIPMDVMRALYRCMFAFYPGIEHSEDVVHQTGVLLRTLTWREQHGWGFTLNAMDRNESNDITNRLRYDNGYTGVSDTRVFRAELAEFQPGRETSFFRDLYGTSNAMRFQARDIALQPFRARLTPYSPFLETGRKEHRAYFTWI